MASGSTRSSGTTSTCSGSGRPTPNYSSSGTCCVPSDLNTALLSRHTTSSAAQPQPQRARSSASGPLTVGTTKPLTWSGRVPVMAATGARA
jgi:hypothetical protein